MAKKKKSGSYDCIRKLIEKEGSRLHFIGIGGVSMYSLSRLAASRGAIVSGSDREESKYTASLRSLGSEVFIGHNGVNALNKDLVIYSHAISEDNPELIAAKEKEITAVNRAEFLGAFMTEYNKRVGVSGTHGKSTTVAMLDFIFAYAKLNHTTLSGAALLTGEPFRMGGTDLLLYEGCEYKDSFLKFSPTYMLALNLEYDHPDYFKDINALKDSFKKAFLRSENVILNLDDENLKTLVRETKAKSPLITFGQGERADYRYRIISFEPGGCRFSLEHNGEEIAIFETRIPGAYNVTNAAAAAVTALMMGVAKEDVFAALSAFSGIDSRLQYLGNIWGKDIYRDYAHHPTEIRAALNALKIHSGDTVTVVFKPHTYSRTKAFFEDFKMALSLADNIIITDIYPAREAPIPGITAERLAYEIGSKAVYSADEEVKDIINNLEDGAVVLMGAGDMEKIKAEILRI